MTTLQLFVLQSPLYPKESEWAFTRLWHLMRACLRSDPWQLKHVLQFAMIHIQSGASDRSYAEVQVRTHGQGLNPTSTDHSWTFDLGNGATLHIESTVHPQYRTIPGVLITVKAENARCAAVRAAHAQTQSGWVEVLA